MHQDLLQTVHVTLHWSDPLDAACAYYTRESCQTSQGDTTGLATIAVKQQ